MVAFYARIGLTLTHVSVHCSSSTSHPERYSGGKFHNSPPLLSHTCPAVFSFDGYVTIIMLSPWGQHTEGTLRMLILFMRRTIVSLIAEAYHRENSHAAFLPLGNPIIHRLRRSCLLSAYYKFQIKHLS